MTPCHWQHFAVSRCHWQSIAASIRHWQPFAPSFCQSMLTFCRRQSLSRHFAIFPWHVVTDIIWVTCTPPGQPLAMGSCPWGWCIHACVFSTFDLDLFAFFTIALLHRLLVEPAGLYARRRAILDKAIRPRPSMRPHNASDTGASPQLSSLVSRSRGAPSRLPAASVPSPPPSPQHARRRGDANAAASDPGRSRSLVLRSRIHAQLFHSNGHPLGDPPAVAHAATPTFALVGPPDPSNGGALGPARYPAVAAAVGQSATVPLLG